MPKNNNYSSDRETLENFNADDRYDITGESEFSRGSVIPFDEDEVLSERHYNFAPHGREVIRRREIRQEDFRGRGPRGYRKSDEAIKEDVSEALYRSSGVDASDIEVFVEHGHVTLKGTVASREQKKLSESLIEHLAGVDDVYNELHIRDSRNRNETGRGGLIQNRTGMN